MIRLFTGCLPDQLPLESQLCLNRVLLFGAGFNIFEVLCRKVRKVRPFLELSDYPLPGHLLTLSGELLAAKIV